MKLKHDKTKNILYSEKPIESITQYIELIELAEDYLGSSPHWYRGVSDVKYKLEPSATRNNKWQYKAKSEAYVIHEFIHRAQSITDKHHDEWTWYAISQHYGLPTRLLDWSEGALTSLFFSIEDNCDSNSAVWIMDPWRLNDLSANNEQVFCTDLITQTAEDIEFTKPYKVGSTDLPPYPLAISPPHNDRRISTQKGCFTVHGTRKNAFEELSLKCDKPFLIRIDINKKKKAHIRGQLETLGIDNFFIYPDLEGLAKAINWNYTINRVIQE